MAKQSHPKWVTLSILKIISDRVKKQLDKKTSTDLSVSDYCTKAILKKLEDDEK